MLPFYFFVKARANNRNRQTYKEDNTKLTRVLEKISVRDPGKSLDPCRCPKIGYFYLRTA